MLSREAKMKETVDAQCWLGCDRLERSLLMGMEISITVLEIVLSLTKAVHTHL